jgi:hypothetical protein
MRANRLRTLWQSGGAAAQSVLARMREPRPLSASR